MRCSRIYVSWRQDKSFYALHSDKGTATINILALMIALFVFLLRYREKRLKGEYARSNRVKEVSPRTLNLELAYFRAVFNELNRLGEWKGENPLKNMRPFRTEEMEMAWLTHDQISLLLGECKRAYHPDLETVVRICLTTGARWSEAESLRKSQLAKYKITYINTKGRKNRTVPISKELYETLPDDKKAGCLVIVMVRSGLLWKEQASNYRRDNLHTFCAILSPATS